MAVTSPYFSFGEAGLFWMKRPQRVCVFRLHKTCLLWKVALESSPPTLFNEISFRMEIMSSITCWGAWSRGRAGLTDGDHSDNRRWYLKKYFIMFPVRTQSAQRNTLCQGPTPTSRKAQGVNSVFFLLEENSKICLENSKALTLGKCHKNNWYSRN